MRTSRRPPFLIAAATLAAAAVLAAACAGPSPTPPGSIATPSPSPAATAVLPTPSASTADAYPVLIVRADLPDGLHWYVTAPDDPGRRLPLTVPPDLVGLGPATSDGFLALASATRLLWATVSQDRPGDDGAATLTVVQAADLGALGIGAADPACVGPGGAVAVADRETLALTVVTKAGAATGIRVPDALGECTWLDDGRLLADREGDRLVAVDTATGVARPVSGGVGRHPSAGGGLLSLVDRSGAARVVVRGATLGGPAGLALGPILFGIDAAGDELITRATLSPDGGWLAVEATVDPEAAAVRWLRLYRVSAAGASLAAQVRLGAGEQVTPMAGP
jgi:hypothetical protein